MLAAWIIRALCDKTLHLHSQLLVKVPKTVLFPPSLPPPLPSTVSLYRDETETLFVVVFPPNSPQDYTQGNKSSLVSIHLVKFDAAVQSDAAFLSGFF